MENKSLSVHGSIFFLLRKYIIHLHTEAVWKKLTEDAGVPEEFELTKNYPLAAFHSLVAEAARYGNQSAATIQENFGEYLVPDLFVLYKNYLNPEWRTFEVIENTEKVMHGAVRRLNSTANPPILNVSKINPKLLVIDYYSERRMGGLAIGIIKGIAQYYNEADRVSIQAMSASDDARVQIRLDFQ